MIKEKITILIKELTGKDCIDENESLINQGLLDSFSVMILVSKIETEFGVKIELDKFQLSDLDTIKNISNIIQNMKK